MSARILHLRRPPNILLLKTPRNFHVPRRTAHQLRSPYRFSSLSFVSDSHFPKFLRGPVSGAAHFSISDNFLDRLLFGPKNNSFRSWNFASGPTDKRNETVIEDDGPEVAVVLLAWLGAKPKHLKRYGGILRQLRDRQDLLEKIKGCIVDSGGDPVIDPKVWAAGFTTALLKKSSSATYPSPETGEGTKLGSGEYGLEVEKKEPLLIEALLLFAFEKLFSYLLNLPDINRRLSELISILSENQPPCPQLYLYSSGDKVIPFRRVESFIEEQRRSGRRVLSLNFRSSPHVDHYRTFPDLYSSQLHNFLKECLIMGRTLEA